MDKALKELQELKDLVEQLNNSDIDESLDYEKILKDLDTNTYENFKIPVKFINKSTNEDPFYANVGDSGFDLRAFLDESITLRSLERTLIPTGLSFELPPNTELQVRPRSGISLKHGISVLNTPGTVDEGYRGDVGIIAINLSNEEYTINNGDKIAQGVIINVIGQRICDLLKTENLSDTERGSGGFGSTDKQ